MLHHHIGVQKYKQKQWCSVWLLDVEKEAAAIKVYIPSHTFCSYKSRRRGPDTVTGEVTSGKILRYICCLGGNIKPWTQQESQTSFAARAAGK